MILTEKQKKISAKILQVKKIKKKNLGLRQKANAIEDHRKKFVELLKNLSNELIKKDFNIDRVSIPHEKQKKINELISEKGLLIFIMQKILEKIKDFEKIINPDHLIHQYKTKGRHQKYLKNFQDPIDLLTNLRDGNLNPTEVYKIQITKL